VVYAGGLSMHVLEKCWGWGVKSNFFFPTIRGRGADDAHPN
jgi:hypothetical protein